MGFNIEEENFICIFDARNRSLLINNICSALTDITEPEMREIAENILFKLDKMSDEEFSQYEFSPVYGDEETEDD